MAKRKGDSSVEVMVGLLFATLILFVFDPVIAQAFNSALSDPNFANSAAGDLWKAFAAIFELHIDLVVMWISVLAGFTR